MAKSTSKKALTRFGATRLITRLACRIGDRITDWTGYAAIRMSLEKASRPGERTLDLPGYVQINSYCCGAVTAAMVVRYFLPNMPFGRIYGAVNPSPDYGAGPDRVM